MEFNHFAVSLVFVPICDTIGRRGRFSKFLCTCPRIAIDNFLRERLVPLLIRVISILISVFIYANFHIIKSSFDKSRMTLHFELKLKEFFHDI